MFRLSIPCLYLTYSLKTSTLLQLIYRFQPAFVIKLDRLNQGCSFLHKNVSFTWKWPKYAALGRLDACYFWLAYKLLRQWTLTSWIFKILEKNFTLNFSDNKKISVIWFHCLDRIRRPKFIDVVKTRSLMMIWLCRGIFLMNPFIFIKDEIL